MRLVSASTRDAKLRRLRQKLNLGAGPGVAIRKFSLLTGATDYLLMINREVIGVIEAKLLERPFSCSQTYTPV